MDGETDGEKDSKAWEKIGEKTVGVPWGHLPGHNYHDVRARLDLRDGRFRRDIQEVWGSAQGQDEEHGRRDVSGFGESASDAVEAARADAVTSGMDMSWVVQAVGQILRDVV